MVWAIITGAGVTMGETTRAFQSKLAPAELLNPRFCVWVIGAGVTMTTAKAGVGVV